MSLTLPLSQETALVGRIVQSTVTTTSDVVYAEFTDKKTGDARTPQSTTKLFVLSKDSDNFEMIWAESHTTSGGITTINIKKDGMGVVIGRNLLKYGNLSGSATGNKHAINSEIGCAETHIPVEVLNQIIRGLEGTGANVFRVGNETDSNITVYAQNADANKPFIRYDATANKWIFSNNGVSSGDVGGGTGSVTAGDGLDMTAGVISAKGAVQVSNADTNASYLQTKLNAGDGLDEAIGTPGGDETLDLAIDVTDFIDTNYGLTENANDIRINLDTDPGLEFNAGKLRTKVKSGGGITRDSDGLSVDTTISLIGSGTSGEAIDGSSTPQAVCFGSANMKGQITVHEAGTGLDANTNYRFSNAGWTDRNFGNADAGTWVAQSFTYTDAIATTLSVARIVLWLQKLSAPTDDVTVSIYTDDSNKPGTLVTNGISTAIAGTALTTSGQYEPVTFTWATPPVITSGTKYWFVIKRSAANNGTDYYSVAYEGDDYASHSYSVYTASTLSWSTEASNDFLFHLEINVNYNNRVYKADANDLFRGNFVGFTKDNVAAGQPITFYSPGIIMDGFTGLTPGSAYYLSNNIGEITTTNPFSVGSSMSVRVGTALSTTKLRIENRKLYSIVIKNVNAYGLGISENSSTAKYADFLLPLGFRPEKTRITYNQSIVAGANSSCQLDLINTSKAGYLSSTPASGGGTDSGGVALDDDTGGNIGINTFSDNAVRLRVSAYRASYYYYAVRITVEN